MSNNVYLEKRRAQLKALQDNIKAYTDIAEREKRTLHDSELASMRGQQKEAEELLVEIETLTEIEQANHRAAEVRRKVFAMTSGADSVGVKSVETTVDETDAKAEAAGDERATRRVSSTTAVDRDPGHYRRGGNRSFFVDLYRARSLNDDKAALRLVEHARALDTSSDGTGVVPPKWLLDEYAPLARQGRKLANAVRKIDITGDPRPIVLPKQATGADNTLNGSTSVPGQQAGNAENGAVTGTDKWSANTESVTPVTIAGFQDVSRQLLDASTPQVDGLIYADLIAAYDEQVEKRIGALILASGPTTLAASEGPGIAPTNPAHFVRVAGRAAIEVRKNRKLPASLLAMSVSRYGDFLDVVDSTGRPLIPTGSDGPMNVFGIGSASVDGRLRELGIIATEGITDDAEFAAFRPQDTILFEGTVMRFRFEEVVGPQSIRLGIWNYVGAIVRYASSSVQTVTVTEES